MVPVQRRINLLKLRFSRRRFHSDLEVMEALWDEFEAAMATETEAVQPEVSPLFNGSSLRLRHWTLEMECWRRGEADSVRELLRHQPFLALLVTELDRRLQERRLSTGASQSEGSLGERRASEGISDMLDLTPPVRQALLADTDHLGVQNLVHGEGDYLRAVRDTLRLWRLGATLSPRADCIINQVLVTLWLQMGYQWCVYKDEGIDFAEAPADIGPSSRDEASLVADATIGRTTTPTPTPSEVDPADTSTSATIIESPYLLPSRRYIDQVLRRI